MTLLDDPAFWRFPVTAQLVSMGVFLLAAGPLTALAWLDPARLRPYRLQSRCHAARKQVPKAALYWLGNNLLMFALVVLLWPWLRELGVDTSARAPSVLEVAASLALFIVLDDFAYYWMHRGFHAHPVLYERIHKVHHRVVTPWALAAHTMHPVEFILTGALTLLWPVLFGAHVVTIWCWVAFRQLEAADGHSGYVLPWNPLHLVPTYKGAGFHDLHHARFRGNYAGFLPYLDRLFGTQAEALGARAGAAVAAIESAVTGASSTAGDAELRAARASGEEPRGAP